MAYRSRYGSRYKSFRLLCILLAVIIAIGAIGITAASVLNVNEYVVLVTDKERVVSNGGSESKYLVYCEEEDGTVHVFENTDTIWRGKWNSSDIQAKLKSGCFYKVEVIGYRIPYLSCYQNIISVEKVE